MTAPTAPFSADATGVPSPRAILRLGGLAGWTLLCALGWGGGRLVGGRWRWTIRCRSTWARGALRILAVRLRVGGTPPTKGYLLAPNHLSYLDVLLLGASLPVRFVAKQEVRGWPVWGTLAWWTGTIFIDRDRPRDAIRVADRLGEALQRDEAAVIFAEGTSSAGDEVLPFRPALFEAAVTTGRPVVPAYLQYRVDGDPEAARHLVCWWGEMEFGPHLLALAGLRSIEADLVLGDALSPGEDRGELARRAHDATTALRRTFLQKDGPTC